MLSVAIGSGRSKRAWVFGLRWVQEHAPEETGKGKAWTFLKSGGVDARLKAVKARASRDGAPGFAHTTVEGDTLIGWPDKGSRLKGDEFSAALAIGSMVDDGFILHHFVEENTLWGLILHKGSPMANGEYLIPVNGDEKTALSILLDHRREAEQFLGTDLPIYASSNLEDLLVGFRFSIESFDLSEQLASIKKPKPYQLVKVAGGGAGAQPTLMLGVVAIAVILAVFRDDIWALIERKEPVSVESLSPVGPTPEEKYLADLNIALSGVLPAGPETLEDLYRVLTEGDFRMPGWHLNQVDCESASCRFDWIRDKGGMPETLPGSSMTTLNGAITSKAYKSKAGTLGLTLPLASLNALTQTADYAKESQMNAVMYPTLLNLVDLGYQVTLGPASPLMPPVQGVNPPGRVVSRALSIGGGISGDNLPLLIEIWSKLPPNMNLKKVTLRVGRISSDDRLEIQGTLVTVEGLK